MGTGMGMVIDPEGERGALPGGCFGRWRETWVVGGGMAELWKW